MRLLMQNYAFCVALRYAEWQINFRLYNSENKGRGSFFALKNVIAQKHRRAQPFFKPEKAYCGVYKQRRCADKPNCGGYCCNIGKMPGQGLVTPSK